MEGVKVQIETLLKVHLFSYLHLSFYPSPFVQAASEIGKKVEELVPAITTNSPEDTHPS